LEEAIMKHVLLAAVIAVVPATFALAEETKKDGASSAQTVPMPDWDKRVAGQGVPK
jgi:hypothetical protein